MDSEEKTREALAREVAELRQQVDELKADLARARGASDTRYGELAGGEPLRALAEASPDCVFVVGRDATVRYVNAASARVFGRRTEDLVGRALGEVFPPAAFEAQQQHIRRVFETGQPSFAETKTVFPGQTLWLETLLVPLGWGGGGEVQAILGIAHDITSRRRAEEALEASERRYRSLVGGIQDGIYEMDREGRFTFINDAIVRRSGRPREWFLGRSYLELIRPEDRERAKRNVEAVVRGETVRPYELAYPTGSGERVDIEVSTTAIWEGGQIVGLSGLSRNITERRRAEEALSHRVAMEKAVAAISARFIGLPAGEVDRGIREALEAIGRLAGADRSCVFLVSADGRTFNYSFEWCADGVEPQSGNRQGLRSEDYPWSMAKLHRLEPVQIPRVADLPPEAGPERRDFGMQGTQSLVLVPMAYGRRLVGFLGFDRVRAEKAWADEDVALLETVGDIFVGALQRRRDEEALRRSEVEKQAILDSLSEVVEYLDPDLRIVWANRATAESLRQPLDQIVGCHCYEIWHHRPEPCPGCPTAEALRTGKPHAAEIQNPDGTIWIVRGYPVRGAEGRIVGAVDLALDITDRKRTEQALRDSEERHRRLMETAHDAIFVAEAETGILVECNERAADLIGRPAAEIIGQHFTCLLPPEDAELRTRSFQRIAREGGHGDTEGRVVRADGTAVWVQMSVSAFQAAGKQFTLGIFHDLTERWQAEDAVREREARLRAIIEAFDGYIYICSQDHRVEFMNDKFLQRTGYNPIGQPCYKALHGLDTVCPWCVNDRVFQGETVRWEVQSPKDGRWLYVVNTPLYHADGSMSKQSMAMDITDRKRAEQALRDSEERYRRLMETAHDAIVVVDAETGAVVECNERAADLVGRPAAEVIGQDFTLLHPPEEREYHRRELSEHTGTLGSGVAEGRVQRADGSTAWVRISINPFQAGGRKFGLGIFHDLTERRQAEQALRDSEERYRRLMETAYDAIFVLDAETGILVECNPRAADLIGRPAAEILGQHFTRLHPPEDAEFRTRNFLRIARETGHGESEGRVLRADGTTAWVRNSASTFEVGGRKFVMGIFHDLTARREAEEALRESEERFHAFMDHSPTIAFAKDEAGRYIYVNKTYEKRFGVRLEDRRGKTDLEIWPPELAQEFREGDRAALATGLPAEFTEEIPGPEGTRVIWSVFKFPFQDASGRRYVGGIGLDVTERRSAEEALRRSEAEKQAILDSVSEMVTYLDTDMRIVWGNRATSQRAGRPIAEIVGLHCYELWHGRAAPCPGCPTAQAISTGEPHAAEITSIEGRTRLVRGYPVRDAEGRIVGGVDFALDITERKRAEEALRRRIEFEEALSDISTRFINLPADEVDTAITAALEAIGRLTGAERCSLFLLSDDGSQLRPGCHWFAEGIEPALVDMAHPWSIARLRAGGIIHVPRVADLPPEAGPEKAYFEARGVRSFVSVPTMYGQSLVGLLAFSSVRSEKAWAPEDIALLKTLADIFASALQRRTAEQVLRESEERYRTLVATSQEGIWTVDAEGKTTLVNRRMAQMLGYPADEVMGRDFLEFMDADGRRQAQRDMKRRRQGVRGRRDLRFRRKNGSDLWTIVSTSPILGADGQTQGYLYMVVDITRRKGDERQLRASEARYRSIFEDSPISLCEEDLSAVMARLAHLRGAGVEDLSQYFQDHPEAVAACARKVKLLAANRATLDLYGAASAEDFRGGLAKVFCEESYPVFARELVALAEGKTPFESEAVNTTLSGERKLVLLRVSVPEGEAGSWRRVLVSLLDLTEKRKLEEKLSTARKLESIGLFAGGVAHDFSNLLTGVAANLARAQLSLDDPPQALDALAQAEQAALRARGLIQQLLAFSRGAEPVRKPTALPDLLSETATLALAGTNASHRVDLPGGLWTADIDPLQIGQVIQNLVLNAAEAMPEGGIVEIRAANVHVRDGDPLPLRAGPYVRVSVADRGVGIPQENLPRIFDPFFSTKKTGSGLGLAVCYAIVQRHGGHIAVESTPAEGSAFHVYLPAAAAEPERPAAGPPPRPRAAGKILLMDDEDVIRHAAAWLLRDAGYAVESAREGAQAVQLYRQALEAGQPFDAVILDLTVARGMGGKEAIQRLRAMDPGVRAIVCSGYSEEPIVADFAQHGFRGAIVKPFAIDELLSALENALRTETRRS